jgi:hypothetical protein
MTPQKLLLPDPTSETKPNEVLKIVEAAYSVDSNALMEFSVQGANHWIDIRTLGRLITIEWRPGIGFGISAPALGTDIGLSGHHETFRGLEFITCRLRDIMLNDISTKPGPLGTGIIPGT